MIQKRLFLTLLFVYFLASFIGATHIHHDNEGYHDDCQVCILAQTLHCSDTPPKVFHLETLYLPTQVPLLVAFYHDSRPHIYHKGQAPPYIFPI